MLGSYKKRKEEVLRYLCVHDTDLIFISRCGILRIMLHEGAPRFSDGMDRVLNELYPTPRQRIENPLPTAFNVGDLVKVLVGPSTGKNGLVVVDRNGNYVDYEPYSSADSIAVSVYERKEMDPTMERIIVELTQDPESMYHRQVRWFDGPDQLELVQKTKQEEK